MDRLVSIVSNLLDDFYRRRIEKINTLELKNTLTRKNPYLYKATGVQKASDIVQEILNAYMSSSDEGIFGDAFFEPLAEQIGDGHVSETEGVDVIIEDEKVYKAIAVKSGINVFNADSRRKQIDNFKALRSRVAKRRKFFDAIVGYGYGKKQSVSSDYREIAGQAFWEELTGDPDFYVKIIGAMEDKPQQHAIEYRKAFDAALNRFTKQFIDEFCFEDGTIDWEKIVRFNSGKVCKTLIVTPQSRTLKKGEELKIRVSAVFSEDEKIDNPDDANFVILSGKENIDVTSNGLVLVNSEAESGSQSKILVESYGKSRIVTIKVSKRG